MQDDGQGGNFTSVGAELSASTFTFNVTGLVIGQVYRYYVVIRNEVGTANSNIVTSIAASVPQTPVNAPTMDLSQSNTTSIRIVMDQITEDGGSLIISY